MARPCQELGCFLGHQHAACQQRGRDWEPQADGLQVERICANVIPDASCLPMKQYCGGTVAGMEWVQECCRSTCGTCSLSRKNCPVTRAASLLAEQAGNVSRPGAGAAAPQARRLRRKAAASA